jgi:hypothetical protein
MRSNAKDLLLFIFVVDNWKMRAEDRLMNPIVVLQQSKPLPPCFLKKYPICLYNPLFLAYS